MWRLKFHGLWPLLKGVCQAQKERRNIQAAFKRRIFLEGMWLRVRALAYRVGRPALEPQHCQKQNKIILTWNSVISPDVHTH